MAVAKQCTICGKEYSCRPSQAEKSKYCSYACLGKSKAFTNSGENHKGYVHEAIREKVCQHCGITFQQRKKEPLTSFLKKKFCSKPCADIGGHRYLGTDHPNWTGYSQRNKRGRLMEQWGSQVKVRDGYKCVKCGCSQGELHAHHIKSWNDYPELRFDVNNGITVCPPCHWKIHTAQNENSVNSVEPLTDGAEGNTEPSFGRKPVEGVTTRGQVYRRWFGYCAECKKQISKRFSDTIGKSNLFCGKKCASTFNYRTGKIGRKDQRSMTVNSSTSAGRESDDIV